MTRPGEARSTSLALGAIVLGFAVGLLGHASGGPGFATFVSIVGPVGDLWLTAFQMTVIPLLVALLFTAIAGAGGRINVASTGAKSLLFFLTVLVASGLFTVAVVPAFLDYIPVDSSVIKAASALATATTAPPPFITTLLPKNVFDAAARGDILALMVFSIVLSTAARHLPDDLRHMLLRGADAVARMMMIIVGWVVVWMPVGTFVLTCRMAGQMGSGAAGALAMSVVLQCGLLLAFCAAFYPAAAVLGRVPVTEFARAVLPAQMISFATRSSLAALPALVQGAERLRIPKAATGFVLPLAAAVFKANRPITSLAKALILAHIYGRPLSVAQLAAFFLMIVLTSFIEPGVPQPGPSTVMLPAYAALGIPLDGVVLVYALDALTDMFKSMFNVTANFTAAVVLGHPEHTVPIPIQQPGLGT